MSEIKNENTSVGLHESDAGAGRIACAVRCPMCNHEHKQLRLNPRMFWNQGMAIDRQPNQYQCLKGLGNAHPPLFELWHCPDCHYTAHNRVFPDPLKNVFIEKGMIPRKYAEARRDPAYSRICEVFGEGLVPGESSFFAALRCAYLAVHSSRFMVDSLRQGRATLAREYLRLGWMYRDWCSMTTEAERAADAKKLRGLLDSVRDIWPDAPKCEADALELACREFELSLDENSMTNDAVERISVQQHMGRIYLQIGNMEAAWTRLQRCRKDALDEEQAHQRLLREDERLKAMTEEDRAKEVSLMRRYRQLYDECQELVDMIQKQKRPGGAAAARGPVAAQRKGGFLKGLFGS